MKTTIRTFDYILVAIIGLQILIFPSLENCFALAVSFAGWKLLWKYTLLANGFERYPLVALMLWSLSFFYFYLPPIVTLLEFKPVVFNLTSPFFTYSMQLVYVISLIVAYQLFKSYNKNFLPQIFNSLNFYYIPSKCGCWIIGFIGLASLVFSNDHSNVYAADRSVLDRFFEGFTFMATVPLMFFSIPDNLSNKIRTSNKVILVVYLFILIVCAVLTNRRHNIFLYVMTPLIISLMNKVYFNKLKNVKLRKILVIAVATFVISGPVSDFALAMSIQRAVVYDIKGEELLRETWKSFQDKESLQKQKTFFLEDQEKYSSINYTEYYVDNILLNRLCNMKPIDNSITYASQIDYIFGNSFMLTKLIEKLEYLLPNPILSIVDPKFDKFKESGYGFNDYLINIANHTRGGGYRIGGDSGIALATFGISFPFIVILFYSIFFFVVNSFVCARGGLFFSLYGIAKVFEIFYIFQTNHGIMDDLMLLLRIFPQEIFLYIVVINIVKFLKL